jgi:predicted DNA-binding protein
MKKKPILLNLDYGTIERVDAAAKLMGKSRTAYLREAIQRNLRFFELYERNAHLRIRDKAHR